MTFHIRFIVVVFILFESRALFLIRARDGKESTILFGNESLSKTKSQRQLDHLQLIRSKLTRFANRVLIVSVIVREPFVIYNPPMTINLTSPLKPKEDLNNYSGVAIEVTKRLVEIFNFKVRVIIPSDRQFGVLDTKTGKWTGLLGSLVRNESDLGVTALSITAKRAEYVDFTRAYFVETSSVLLRTPEEVQDFFVIFEPFSPFVWCLLFITMFLLIIVITIMTKLEDNQKLKHEIAKTMRLNSHGRSKLKSNEGLTTIASMVLSHVLARSDTQPKLDNHSQHQDDEITTNLSSSASKSDIYEIRENNHPIDADTHLHEIETVVKSHLMEKNEFGTSWNERLQYSITCVLNILLNKDIKHPPRQSPIRILVCVWWLATIVIVNFYLGTLFEQLVLPRRQRLIDSLEELVNQDKIIWGVTRGSAMQELFSSANERSVYWQIGQKMQIVGSVDEGVKRVIDSDFAFIRERSILKFKLAQEHRKMGSCKMQLAKEEFFSVGFGLAVPKNSPYLEAFNAALTLMIENGFVARWQSDYWPQKSRFTECQSASPNEAKPLSLKHFLSIYLVWALFIGLGFFVLVYQHGKAASIRLLENQQANTNQT